MLNELPERPSPLGPATPPVPPPRSGPRRPLSRKRIWLARAIALAADGIQIVLLPLMMGGAISPVDDALDIVVAIALIALIGWHWTFIPAFISELFPWIDLAPTWTLSVFAATRNRRN